MKNSLITVETRFRIRLLINGSVEDDMGRILEELRKGAVAIAGKPECLAAYICEIREVKKCRDPD